MILDTMSLLPSADFHLFVLIPSRWRNPRFFKIYSPITVFLSVGKEHLHKNVLFFVKLGVLRQIFVHIFKLSSAPLPVAVGVRNESNHSAYTSEIKCYSALPNLIYLQDPQASLMQERNCFSSRYAERNFIMNALIKVA